MQKNAWQERKKHGIIEKVDQKDLQALEWDAQMSMRDNGPWKLNNAKEKPVIFLRKVRKDKKTKQSKRRREQDQRRVREAKAWR